MKQKLFKHPHWRFPGHFFLSYFNSNLLVQSSILFHLFGGFFCCPEKIYERSLIYHISLFGCGPTLFLIVLSAEEFWQSNCFRNSSLWLSAYGLLVSVYTLPNCLNLAQAQQKDPVLSHIVFQRGPDKWLICFPTKKDWFRFFWVFRRLLWVWVSLYGTWLPNFTYFEQLWKIQII